MGGWTSGIAQNIGERKIIYFFSAHLGFVKKSDNFISIISIFYARRIIATTSILFCFLFFFIYLFIFSYLFISDLISPNDSNSMQHFQSIRLLKFLV